jgi:hypothetical protein
VFPDVESKKQVRQREVGGGFPGNDREAVQAIEACEVLPRHVTEIKMCDSTNSVDDDMLQKPYSCRVQFYWNILSNHVENYRGAGWEGAVFQWGELLSRTEDDSVNVGIDQ